MFTVDGVTWNVPCAITRKAEIKPSEISGLMLDGTYFNDVIGTFLSYTVSIAVPIGMLEEYQEIYEKITDPDDGHTFILPYNGGTVQITGRVEDVSDQYVRMSNGAVHWKGTTFTVIANHPTKSRTLNEVVTIGRKVVPDTAYHYEGDTWVWTDGAWELSVRYRNADEIRY